MNAKSGTEVGKVSATIYENINAKSSKRFKEVNMGFMNSQAKTFNCEIISAVFN